MSKLEPKLDGAKLVQYYKDMLLIRRFEEKVGQLYSMGHIGGFCHLYIGQEAVVTGVQKCLRDTDNIITSYRDHAHMLACGLPAKNVMAELTGRRDGLSKGKGGSMHMFSVANHFYGGHGIVGAQVPIGTGLAFAEKYYNTDNITAVYMGDGAVNQGQVAESFNMAALWKLPVLYIIENNQYAMGTSTKRHAAYGQALYKRGAPFNIPGVQVDGMDVLKVEEAARRAVAYCRSGKGPYILEMSTYRYRGHSMSDPAKYRDKVEVATFKEKHDPIGLVKSVLIKNDLADEKTLKDTDKAIRADVFKAAEFALQSPLPEESALWTHVLYEGADQCLIKS